MKKFSLRLATTAIGILLLLVSTNVVAQAPVTDVANTTTNAVTVGNTGWQNIKEEVLKPIVLNLADQVLDKLTDDVINWANSDFNGQPGFINNWDDFIKGTQHETISGAFQTASIVAQQAQQNLNESNDEQYLLCESEAYSDYENDSQAFNQAQADFYLAQALAQCKIEISTTNSVNEYNQCLSTNLLAGDAYAGTIMQGPTQKFFDDFFDGVSDATSPYYAELSPEERLDWETSARIYYQFSYQRDQCINILTENTVAGDIGDAAQNNYNLWQSGQVQSTRAVAGTVATFGAQQLNGNPLDSVIKGEGETLSKLLGSYSAKEQFKRDLFVGGWEGYLALADPHNYDLGLQNLVEGNLQNQVSKNVDKAVEQAQTPIKFKDKTYCVEYKKDAEGNRTDECERELIGTPGDVVADKIKTALGADEDKAKTLSDGLVTSLIGALGKLTGGLLESGVASLGNAANKALFNHNDTNVFVSSNLTSGTYQSEYDVLGIQSNGGGIGNGTESVTIAGAGGNIISTIFVGGPEHDNPQIIINFQESLEKNIDLAEKEQSYYEEIRSTLSGATDVVVEFDKCIPGPDYGWDQRYRDVLSSYSTNGDDEWGQLNAIGLNETKNMIQDNRVTIPGGVEMKDQIEVIFDTVTQSSLEDKFRLDNLRSILSTMRFIRSEILADFNTQKAQISNDLVLFADDWNILTTNQKLNLLEIAYNSGYYSNAIYTGHNPPALAAALQNDEDGVMNGVLSMAWDLWRQETDEEKKLDLRRAFYILESDLPNDQFITIAKNKSNQIKQGISRSYDMALDCMVFKAYAVGTERSQLVTILNTNDQEGAVFALADIIDQYDPNAAADQFPPIGTVFAFYDVDTVRSDPTLRTFLETEYQLQQNQGASVMSTYTMTEPSAINQSILGFSSEADKEAYFDEFYPDDDFPYDENKNKLTVKEMYRVDRAYGQSNRVKPRGARGHLFCRNANEFETVNGGGNHDQHGTACWKDFYSASRLDYQLIISGINN